MTGLWPHTSGCTANNIPLDPAIPTIADMIPDDYVRGYFGKWHLGNEVSRRDGFDRWISIEDMYRPYYTDRAHLSQFSDYHTFLGDSVVEPDAELEGANVFSRPFAADQLEELTKARFVADRASAFIKENRGGPFSPFVNMLEPHPPYIGPFDDLYDPTSMPVGP